MRPQDILELLRREPFEPFRLHLSDGAVFEIRHPELAMVGRSTVLVGIPAPQSTEPVFDRVVNCALVHITRTKAIDGSPTAR